ncbi:SIS domain-containing protein [Microbacterium sp. Au-Mic1]|uniref:SIS domain-containing protein n=1 Tax=Microbacterium sp. Au-Mic1 TaxID=2906457 RepID=UPI001E440742|nr:SIS domain-containing protein [Microbacterium sp. Au-Mic1]MCE4026226.1 SIS domain-containing protein [Microbacterium sp. Au-Mic1]
MNGYVPFAEATATQADALATAIVRVRNEVLHQQAAGSLAGAGPVFLAIGASLAAAAAPVWELRARGIDASRLGSGDTPLPLPGSDRTIVAISQSGRSSETIAAFETVPVPLRYAVVNTRPSPLADLSSASLDLGSIPDSYASTIGYTATIAGLALLGEAWNGGELDPSWAELADVFRRLETTLDTAAASDHFEGAPGADFIGGGASVGSAEAGALLLREVARVPASAMSTRQYLHGAMESAGEGVTVLFGDTREIEVARMLARADHRVVLVTSSDIDAPGVVTIHLPQLRASQRAILEALVLQRIAGDVARRRGIEIEEFVFSHDDTKVGSPE